MYHDPLHLMFIRTNQWMHAVEMQADRVIGPYADPHKDGPVKYRLYWNQKQRDLDFFLIALNRLRVSVISANKEISSNEISEALKEFDKNTPDVKDLRDIAEHLDEYDKGIGKLQKKNKLTQESPSMGWGKENASISYSGKTVTVNEATDAARKLHKTVMEVLEKNGQEIKLDEWPRVQYKGLTK